MPLEFITFTNPDSSRSAANQHRIRSQAMRDFHRRADAPKRRKNEIELDITPLLQQSAQNEAEQDQESHQALSHAEDTGTVSLAPATNLCYSRMDPFFQYPIRMGRRERELYDHRKWSSLLPFVPSSGESLTPTQCTTRPALCFVPCVTSAT
jgi:hypothetical protein